MSDCWRTYNLDLINYQNKCKLIRGWDELFEKVKEHINSVTAMKLSPYYKVCDYCYGSSCVMPDIFLMWSVCGYMCLNSEWSEKKYCKADLADLSVIVRSLLFLVTTQIRQSLSSQQQLIPSSLLIHRIWWPIMIAYIEMCLKYQNLDHINAIFILYFL